MSPKKLSEDDKKEILTLYRESEETTSTLAERYEVSSSTISRFLKASLSLEEYEELIQKKRLARTPYRRQVPVTETINKITSELKSSDIDNSATISELQSPDIDNSATISDIEDKVEKNTIASGQSNKPIKNQQAKILAESLQQLDLFALTKKQEEDDDEDDDDDTSLEDSVLTLQALLGEDIGEIDDYEIDEYEDEDYEDDIEQTVSSSSHPSHVSLEILPLTQAELPKVCYLVIDRRSELITKPLKDFRDLGKIPLTEIQEQTLPIFDNHRIARRFSNRRERVIKVPDSQIFSKTSSYLQAKGITRILLDGQVYSLD